MTEPLTDWPRLMVEFPGLASLEEEVVRLARVHRGDLGRPYLSWKRRLSQIVTGGREFDIAHRHLLALWEAV